MIIVGYNHCWKITLIFPWPSRPRWRDAPGGPLRPAGAVQRPLPRCGPWRLRRLGGHAAILPPEGAPAPAVTVGWWLVVGV